MVGIRIYPFGLPTAGASLGTNMMVQCAEYSCKITCFKKSTKSYWLYMMLLVGLVRLCFGACLGSLCPGKPTNGTATTEAGKDHIHIRISHPSSQAQYDKGDIRSHGFCRIPMYIGSRGICGLLGSWLSSVSLAVDLNPDGVLAGLALFKGFKM